jgi:hypothetical protein
VARDVKFLAFVLSLRIIAVGVLGIVTPSRFGLDRATHWQTRGLVCDRNCESGVSTRHLT